ncbi:MAG TPA: CaiB/BaiF CoA-transferase family protein [Burkholderiaceae bacterium]|nr:CaiB/BaiF CoA-transferase family protein [Burkholderiaceae bacterium]
MTIRPLQGVKVLDLSRVISGPWAAQILADMGADVIKVERPVVGDESRYQGSSLRDANGDEQHGLAATFLAMNRGKRSVTVDLANPEGQALVRRLAGWADVLVENFKPGDLKRYGLDYASLSPEHPRLVYCSISGFGQTGPRSHLPGYDLLFQGFSGLMSVIGVPDGEPGAGPQRVGYPLIDMTTSLFAVIGMLGALRHRDQVSGRGQHIDLSLLDAQTAAMTHTSVNWRVSGVLPKRSGLVSRITVPYQPFPCADGDLIVAVGNDLQFGKLAVALGHPEWATDPRFAKSAARTVNREALAALIEARMRTRTIAEWTAVLNDAGVPCGPIYDLAQMADDPQVRHNGLLREMDHPAGRVPVVGSPLRFSDSPVTYDRPPPLLGQHTDEVLRELGFDDAGIAALRAAKAI